jgi:hypothetical protein
MSVHRAALASSLAFALVALPGCGDAGVRTDAGGDGARQPCVDAMDCDDGVFCNGAETCEMGATGADSFGCVPAADPTCATEAVCDESQDRCVGDCETMPDFDSDGADRVACGGTDCDDTDANRFVGNVEVCDLAGHDEDCDSATLGGRDIDSDGYVDAACCNPDGAGGTECGDDCDDLSPSARPGNRGGVRQPRQRLRRRLRRGRGVPRLRGRGPRLQRRREHAHRGVLGVARVRHHGGRLRRHGPAREQPAGGGV